MHTICPQSVKNHDFCSDPSSVDPICPQPRLPHGPPAHGARAEQGQRGLRAARRAADRAGNHANNSNLNSNNNHHDTKCNT